MTEFGVMITLSLFSIIVINNVCTEDAEWAIDDSIDISTKSWLKSYVRLCGFMCNDRQRLVITPYHQDPPFCQPACFPCDCDYTCPIYGTCCPYVDPSTPIKHEDISVDTYGVNHDLAFNGNLSDIKVINKNNLQQFMDHNPDLDLDEELLNHKFGCMQTSYSVTPLGVYVIGDCPERETNHSLRVMCESNDIDSTTLAKVTPYSDTRSGIVYKNVYCLQCWTGKERATTPLIDSVGSHQSMPINDDMQRYIKWNISIICHVMVGLYGITSIDSFLTAVLKSATGVEYPQGHRPFCEVDYYPPSSNYRECDVEMTTERQETDCIKNDDELAEDGNLCNSLNSEAYRIHRRQNIFCYLCRNEFPDCWTARKGIQFVRVDAPISFLLGFKPSIIFMSSPVDNSYAYETHLCPGALEWMDEGDTCRLPECTKGKLLDSGLGQCRSGVSLIQGLGYKLSMVLVPDRKVPTHYLSRIEEMVTAFHQQLMYQSYLAVYIVGYGNANSYDANTVQYLKIQGNFIAKKRVKRDQFEHDFFQYRFQIKENEPNSNDTINFIPEGFGVDHVSQMGISDYTQGNPEDQYHLPNTRIDSDRSYRTKKKRGIMKHVLYVEVGSPKLNAMDWKLKKDFIDINPTLICPHVVFDIKKISSLNDINMVITFYYRRHERSLNTTSYGNKLNIEGNNLRICIDTFREEFQKITVKNATGKNNTDLEITWMSMVKRHLTISCLILSIVCLLITSFTYLIFGQLRTLPGLNTLSLCLTLASAQLSLILVVELIGYVHGNVCHALGIVLHYTWLCSFCWMCVSCAHMYSVFKGTSTRQAFSDPRRRFNAYCVSTFGTSAVIVSLHICFSEILSDGTTTGYSDQFCFLDIYWSGLTALISFVTPLAIVVTVNAVLFGITVREIVTIRRLQATSRMKVWDEVVTYVKLSTITGVQWFATILAVRLENDVADIISALLVGLQGVFIFVSFTLNANTRKLYRGLFGKLCCNDSENRPCVSNPGESGMATQSTAV